MQRRIDLATGQPDVAAVAAAIEAATLTCFPTDTVYGVGGPCRSDVLRALRLAKRRGVRKPLQVIFPSRAALDEVLRSGTRLREALEHLVPGPVTLVVPYPERFSGPPPGHDQHGSPTLGVRVPRWPGPARAMESVRVPLVASSANTAGAPAPRRVEEVERRILSACDLVVDAGPVAGVPSTVVDLAAYEETGVWRILRLGAVSAEQLTAVLGPQTRA